LPGTHQSRAARNPPKELEAEVISIFFNRLPQLRTVATTAGMAPAVSVIEQMLKP
jgi:hypothetical protein